MRRVFHYPVYIVWADVEMSKDVDSGCCVLKSHFVASRLSQCGPLSLFASVTSERNKEKGPLRHSRFRIPIIYIYIYVDNNT